MKTRIGILGGSGYGGSELLRLLLFHPHVEVTFATSRKFAGKPLYEALPNLRGSTKLSFVPFEPEKLAREADVLFSAIPHGGEARQAIAAARRANPKLRVIDLSGDHRLKDPVEHEKHYGAPPEGTAGQEKEFVYGLTEWYREEIRAARCVANPGCFATAVQLALLPLAKKGWLSGWVVVDAVTGSTGLGVVPVQTGHHPERSENFQAYGMLNHRHMPEVFQSLARLGTARGAVELSFVPHSGPLARAIFATCHARLPKGVGEAEVAGAFEACYGREPFVRLLGKKSPSARVVAQTNFADIGWAVSGDRAVLLCAIDNLVKGEAGQAVQNLNVMMGWEETEGLRWPGTTP